MILRLVKADEFKQIIKRLPRDNDYLIGVVYDNKKVEFDYKRFLDWCRSQYEEKN